jgi:TRAP-type C4-dicarboxylate transport system permease small subunit
LRFDKKDLKDNFELYIGGIFITITVCIVIMNVFTRYVLKFTYSWSEEVSVGCFVWSIFMGAAGAFRKKMLMGVDFLLQITWGKGRAFIELLSNLLVFACSVTMCILSAVYMSKASKLTDALRIPYKFIYVSVVLAFIMISIYALINFGLNIKKILTRKNKAVKTAPEVKQ